MDEPERPALRQAGEPAPDFELHGVQDGEFS